VERVLLRALAVTDVDFEAGRRLVAEAVTERGSYFEHLGAYAALQALAVRGSRDPMEVVEDETQRALLADALLGEAKPPEENEVRSAIQEVEERALENRQRELRGQIAEAERRGDYAELAVLTQKKLEIDQALRRMRRAGE
jgi:DNA primase